MKRTILGLILAASLNGGVTLDNWHVGSNNSGSGSTTWTHTNGCSSDCVGYVLFSSINSAVTNTVTWGGRAMTLVTQHARTYGTNGPGTFYVYCIVAPPAGAATISGTSSAWLIGTSVTFSGARQSCTADATAFQEAASGCPFNGGTGLYECPAAITPAASNAYVFGMFSQVGSNLGGSPTSTSVFRTTTNLYADYYVYDSNGTVSGSFALKAGDGTTNATYSGLAVSVAPAASSSGSAAAANPTVIVVGPQ